MDEIIETPHGQRIKKQDGSFTMLDGAACTNPFDTSTVEERAAKQSLVARATALGEHILARAKAEMDVAFERVDAGILQLEQVVGLAKRPEGEPQQDPRLAEAMSKIAEQETELDAMRALQEDATAEIADLDGQIVTRDAAIVEKDALIASLRLPAETPPATPPAAAPLPAATETVAGDASKAGAN